VKSVSFDRVADRYDQTRGGLERGARYAATLDRFLPTEGPLLEVGVGTGAIAMPLTELGHTVCGIDLSRAMLGRAATRVARLVEGDASVLPFASGSFGSVVAVWTIHLVGDLDALVRECRRLLRPGGRLLSVSSTPDVEPNDLLTIAFRYGKELGHGWDRAAALEPRMAGLGFRLDGEVETDVFEFDESPNDRADAFEQRVWSSLWDLDQSTWDRHIQPIIDDLRALPSPDEPRHCVQRHYLSVYERV